MLDHPFINADVSMSSVVFPSPQSNQNLKELPSQVKIEKRNAERKLGIVTNLEREIEAYQVKGHQTVSHLKTAAKIIGIMTIFLVITTVVITPLATVVHPMGPYVLPHAGWIPFAGLGGTFFFIVIQNALEHNALVKNKRQEARLLYQEMLKTHSIHPFTEAELPVIDQRLRSDRLLKKEFSKLPTANADNVERLVEDYDLDTELTGKATAAGLLGQLADPLSKKEWGRVREGIQKGKRGFKQQHPGRVKRWLQKLPFPCFTPKTPFQKIKNYCIQIRRARADAMEIEGPISELTAKKVSELGLAKLRKIPSNGLGSRLQKFDPLNEQLEILRIMYEEVKGLYRATPFACGDKYVTLEKVEETFRLRESFLQFVECVKKSFDEKAADPSINFSQTEGLSGFYLLLKSGNIQDHFNRLEDLFSSYNQCDYQEVKQRYQNKFIESLNGFLNLVQDIPEFKALRTYVISHNDSSTGFKSWSENVIEKCRVSTSTIMQKLEFDPLLYDTKPIELAQALFVDRYQTITSSSSSSKNRAQAISEMIEVKDILENAFELLEYGPLTEWLNTFPNLDKDNCDQSTIQGLTVWWEQCPTEALIKFHNDIKTHHEFIDIVSMILGQFPTDERQEASWTTQLTNNFEAYYQRLFITVKELRQDVFDWSEQLPTQRIARMRHRIEEIHNKCEWFKEVRDPKIAAFQARINALENALLTLHLSPADLGDQKKKEEAAALKKVEAWMKTCTNLEKQIEQLNKRPFKVHVHYFWQEMRKGKTNASSTPLVSQGIVSDHPGIQNRKVEELKIQHLLKEVDRNIVTTIKIRNIGLEGVLRHVAVTVLVIVDAYIFSNSWTGFAITLGIVGMMAGHRLVDYRLHHLQQRKKRLQMLERLNHPVPADENFDFEKDWRKVRSGDLGSKNGLPGNRPALMYLKEVTSKYHLAETTPTHSEWMFEESVNKKTRKEQIDDFKAFSKKLQLPKQQVSIISSKKQSSQEENKEASIEEEKNELKKELTKRLKKIGNLGALNILSPPIGSAFMRWQSCHPDIFKGVEEEELIVKHEKLFSEEFNFLTEKFDVKETQYFNDKMKTSKLLLLLNQKRKIDLFLQSLLKLEGRESIDTKEAVIARLNALSECIASIPSVIDFFHRQGLLFKAEQNALKEGYLNLVKEKEYLTHLESLLT